jgi:amino acid transporter
MTQAAFSYVGTEIVAIAAGEAKNPRECRFNWPPLTCLNCICFKGKNLPKAIKRVYIRILLFYIGGTFIIGLLVPSDDPGLNLKDKNAAASPFVIAYVIMVVL